MDAYSQLFDLIAALARRRYTVAERSFATLGLNHTEARLLRLLAQAGDSATQDSLAQQLFIDRSNAGRALKALEHKGYIARQKDLADKRANVVCLTEKGAAMVIEIVRLRETIAQAFFGDLSAEDAARAVEILERLAYDEPNI
ncbi:MarR family transcriptional regulator [Chloroflexia bacterium SDU3-3]|nr:MarR family transcriptional regulator [Chloroflexia bacterium SDU3-3]